MDLYVVIAQRKERYEGEYGLEALAVMSDVGQEENPQYLQDVLTENRASGEFDAVAIATLKVSRSALEAVLYPNVEPVQATVVAGA